MTRTTAAAIARRVPRWAALGSLTLWATGLIGGVTAWAGAYPEAEVQGFYEGTGKDAAGEFKIEARVVGEDKGTYKVLVRRFSGTGDITRVELAGKTSGEAVTFTGKAGDLEWKGGYADGAVQGECGPAGSFQVKRVEMKSPTSGRQPPAGAIVLLDGKDFSAMVRANGANWYWAT